MDPSIIKNISSQIYRQFPEMDGVQPKARLQPAPESNGDRPRMQTYLITFNTQVRLETGKSMPRWVRVVVNEKGKVLKITTSR
jgi:hypothetical protein